MDGHLALLIMEIHVCPIVHTCTISFSFSEQYSLLLFSLLSNIIIMLVINVCIMHIVEDIVLSGIDSFCGADQIKSKRESVSHIYVDLRMLLI